VRSHFLEARSSLEPDGETNGLIAALGTRSHSAAVQRIESAAQSEIGPMERIQGFTLIQPERLMRLQSPDGLLDHSSGLPKVAN
jgi:hypothetical protein